MRILFLFSILMLSLLAQTVRAESWNNPPAKLPVGTQHKTFHSESMNLDVGYCIYLPPDYEADATKRYPVVYYCTAGAARSHPIYSTLRRSTNSSARGRFRR